MRPTRTSMGTSARAASGRGAHAPALAADSPWGRFALAWGDDELLLAHQLGHMLSRYTEFEELIAIGSLSQDDLAHAQLLHALVEPDARERDRLFFERDPGDFRACAIVSRHLENWDLVIARQYLYKAADELRLREAAERAPAPLRAAAVGMAAEEQLHRAHWQHWCEVLAASGQGNARLRGALAELWPHTGDLFSLPDAASDLDWPAAELTQEWRASVTGFLGGLGVQLPDDIPAPAAERSGVTDPAMLSDLKRSRRVYEREPTGVWG